MKSGSRAVSPAPECAFPKGQAYWFHGEGESLRLHRSKAGGILLRWKAYKEASGKIFLPI